MNNLLTHIDYVSPALAKANLSGCCLYFSAGAKKIIQLILDEAQEVLLFKVYHLTLSLSGTTLTSELKRILEQEPFNNSKFETVKFALSNNKWTLVPDAFPVDDRNAVLKFSVVLDSEHVALEEPVRPLRHRMLFGVEKELFDLLKSRFENVKIYPAAVPFLDAVGRDFERSIGGNRLYVNVDNRTVEMAAGEDEITFYNKFAFRTTKDFIYYVLMVCDELKLDQQRVKIVLSGDIEENSALSDSLAQYFSRISYAGRPVDLQLPDELAGLEEHSFYNLFNLILCA